MKINDFKKYKLEKKKISMITCYDYWSAKLVSNSNIDCILVGDSVAMVMHGHNSTIPATTELIKVHTHAVSKGAPKKFIVADMPFLTFRKGIVSAMDTVHELISAGANCVKLEGVDGHEDVVKHIVDSGVPVMGHLGLTPQSIQKFGGFRVQAKEDGAKNCIVNQAKKLEELGCFAIVLECIPANIARDITEAISIPTIGIGAGNNVDGQVLVLQDMLGMDSNFNPTFLKKYLNGAELITNALNCYNEEVKEGAFPSKNESY